LEIVDLKPDNISKALCCEHNEGHWVGGVEERRKFLLWALAEGKIRGKIAVEGGERAGWIDYYPRPNGWVIIGCIVVDEKHKGRGVGRALVNACLEDCKGSKGVMVGATIWDHMPKEFFKKFGFTDIDEKSPVSIMAVKFGEEAPETKKEDEGKKYAPKLEPGRLVIDMFDIGECPTSYVTRELVKEAAKDFGDKIIIREYDRKDKAVAEKFGGLRGIFIDGESVSFGYPGEIEEIRETLRSKLEVGK